jgi:hypothetical protein
MKKITLFIVCALSLAVAKAQVKYGAKAGLNLSNVSGDVSDNKTKIALHFGAFANFGIADRFSVQPELVFSAQGAKFEDDGDNDNLKLTYLNIPLLAQYNDPSGFYAESGPQIGFMLSGKYKEDGNTSNIKDGLKTVDLSWGFGAGYKFSEQASAGLRYNLGLSNVNDGSGKIRNSVFQLSVAYTLGTTK